MQSKQDSFNKLWHSDGRVEQNVIKKDKFNFEDCISLLQKFGGTYPKVMMERINKKPGSLILIYQDLKLD